MSTPTSDRMAATLGDGASVTPPPPSDPVPATDQADARTPKDPPGDSADGARQYLVPVLLALVVAAMAALMLATRRPGHWWGDDWALYLRQAQSLLDGNPGAITADNEFTVDQSLGAPFSPPLYPWGFPMILAPFVAIVGIDLDRLAIVPVLSACVFACAWFALARRRVGDVAAIVGTVAATITPLLLSWSELIQSEWPFLAITFAMLAAIDRAIESEVLVDVSARWWPVIAIGVGAAAAFTVRREGLAMTAAIGAAQIALLTTGGSRLGRLFRDRRLALRIAAPHLSALATVYLLQWTLPSTLVPRYSGTSITNTWGFAERHIRHLAEVSGLKRPFDAEPVVLGSATLGWVAVGAYLIAAGAGLGLALNAHRRRDLHLAVYAAVAFAIGGSFRSALNRYVATVAPVLFLLGLVAIVALAGRSRIRWGRAVAVIVAATIVAGNVTSARERLENTERIVDQGVIEWGPTHPLATEMFDVVTANSDLDDVVAGPKARALTLMTDRRSIQVDQWRPLPTSWSPTLVVAERNSPVERQLRDDERDRYVELWANTRFVVFEALVEPQIP